MILNQVTFFKLSILINMVIWLYPIMIFAYDLLNESKIKHDLQRIQQSEHVNTNQKIVMHSLQSALHFINEKKLSSNKIEEYQKIINNFSYMTMKLRDEYNNIDINYIPNIYQNLSIDELKKKLPQIYNQLMDLSEQLKQEENQIRSIHESLRLLPQQQIIIRNILHNLERRQQIFYVNVNTPLEYAKFTAFQAEQAANRLKIVELEFAQLSASNRKELSKLKIALLKKKYDYANDQLRTLRNQLNHLRCKNLNRSISDTEKMLFKKYKLIPKSIKNQLQINHDLLNIIAQQMCYINEIFFKKTEIETHILEAQQIFSDLIEQSQWLDKSPILGETLRAQVSKLPKAPKFQQLDNNIAQLKTKRLQYSHRINQLSTLLSNNKQNNNSIKTTSNQKDILEKQLNIQHELIVLIISNYDAQILETTKLKLSYEQLKNILQEIQEATHRYLFWVADVHPITISYFIDVYHDLLRLLTDKTLHQHIKSTLYTIYDEQKILILIILSTITLVSLHFGMQYHYYEFLKRSSKYIGKVKQDNFLITFYNIWSSICVAMPIPIAWMIIGYNLSHNTYPYSIITSIGDGMHATTFMLWAFITFFYFAASKGLFIMHFGWCKKRIRQVFSKNYICSVTIIMFLTIGLIVFNNYNNREFYNTLSRLCFILLCIYLSYIMHIIKQSKFPLYINKYDSSNNIINQSLWNIVICAPIIAAVSCAYGYLFAAQALLTRLETSLFIWSILLIIYYIIRRWMFIQRRRIAFERAKKKRAIQLFLRTHNKSNISLKSNQKKQLFFTTENDKKILDLDTISTQSLQLIRSIITLIALLLMTLLWSELRFAFSFLENITLWDVTSTIKGVDNIQPITLNTFLIVIVVITITTITVRNLPAFLELTLLQHLHLTPGTSYAITTLTKYSLMLLGSIIGFSLVGIEWNKIQWLIAALGVGLGFGLQEIFANFISGLMILFEKPVRIGDTVTIQNFTGNVTKINTRATIITDWDQKEIIVPNKEFITKQFTNWSLSNSITRVILRIPTPLQMETDKIPNILLNIIKQLPLALEQPAPEIYLINFNQGFPIFEIRIYTENIKSRIPLCHQINTKIIQYYKNHGLTLPFLPLCCHKELTANNNINNTHSNVIKSFY